MSTGVVSVQLEKDLKNRLDALSAATGRPVSYLVREAVAEHLSDMEYAYELREEVEYSSGRHRDEVQCGRRRRAVRISWRLAPCVSG